MTIHYIWHIIYLATHDKVQKCCCSFVEHLCRNYWITNGLLYPSQQRRLKANYHLKTMTKRWQGEHKIYGTMLTSHIVRNLNYTQSGWFIFVKIYIIFEEEKWVKREKNRDQVQSLKMELNTITLLSHLQDNWKAFFLFFYQLPLSLLR